jgi:hypothetical protein
VADRQSLRRNSLERFQVADTPDQQAYFVIGVGVWTTVINRRNFLASASAASFVLGAEASAWLPADAAVPTGWRVLKIGGGGQLIGITQSDDGLSTVVNTDTAGPWFRNTTTKEWEALISVASMPAAWTVAGKPASKVVDYTGFSCYEIVVAPSNKDLAYMIYGLAGNLNKSSFFSCSNLTSAAPTWTEMKNFPSSVFQYSNNESNWPSIGPKMGVDPANPNIVYMGFESQYGTASHPIVTMDGGNTFNRLTSIPIAISDPRACVGGWCFDRTSAVTSSTIFGHSEISRLSTIWCCSSGNNVYRSIDGGAAWLAVPGSQTDFYSMSIDKNDGTVYLVPRDFSGFYRYKSGAWSTKKGWIAGGPLNSEVWVAPDPAAPGRLAAVGWNGAVKWSSDHGDTWTGTGVTRKNKSDLDVPWMAVNPFAAHYIGVGRAMYDNALADKLIVNDGIGCWYTMSSSGDAIFFGFTAGLQQLVTNKICSPWVAGAKPIVCSWDRAAFIINDPEEYATTYYPLTGSKNDIHMGWDIDWASADPQVLALLDTWGTATQNNSSISRDGGLTWKPFANFPYYPAMLFAGGAIAISDTNHIMAALSNNGPLIYSTDAGATAWTEETLSAFGGRAANARYSVSVTATRAAIRGDMYVNSSGSTVPVAAGCVICTCADTSRLRSNIDIIPNGSGTTVADIGLAASQIGIINSTHFAALDRTWTTNQSGAVFFYITTGNGFAYYLNRRNICADRKAPNTFYYANSNPTASGGGVYKISFPNDIYTITRQRNTPMPADGAHSKIRAVPYNGIIDTTGHLFWTAGIKNSDGARLEPAAMLLG